GYVEPFRMRLSVLGDFFEDLLQPDRGLPIPLTFCHGRVQHHPGNIIRSWSGVAPYAMFSEPRRAPGAKLRERHCRGNTAADVLEALNSPLGRLHLLPDKRCHIARMQAVAHLMSVPIETDVLQWTPPWVRVNPKGKNSL